MRVWRAVAQSYVQTTDVMGLRCQLGTILTRFVARRWTGTQLRRRPLRFTGRCRNCLAPYFLLSSSGRPTIAISLSRTHPIISKCVAGVSSLACFALRGGIFLAWTTLSQTRYRACCAAGLRRKRCRCGSRTSAEPRLWALAMPSDPTELSRSAAVSTDAAAISARSFLDTLSEQQARSPEAS